MWLKDPDGLEKLKKWTEKWKCKKKEINENEFLFKFFFFLISKGNELSQNEIDILEEIYRNEQDTFISYENLDYPITSKSIIS